MAGVTWTRTRISTPPPSGRDVELMALRMMDALGREGVAEIRDRIWAIRRFKRPTGRSTKAWTYRMVRRPGIAEIVWQNAAVDRGVNYPRYVHLAGRPKSDRLMYEVEAWARDDVRERLAIRFMDGYEEILRKRPRVTTKEVL